MSVSRDTPKLANHGLNSLSKLIESDTEVSTIDLNLLENLNTNQSLNYIKLEQNLNSLEKNAKQIEQLHTEFLSYDKILEDIESKVSKIEVITKELNAWSKELEEKVKRR
ncbi:biogenesis of lysosome-related organelles complex-1, subunit 2 [Scheffersomyces xylosifermentans]|uniref:biogenesis of lysosome-related organelles complex-1, subunit 2 n=1 Tax=Scheffersomyces xylosifermentans TaxID=1304137 RepID=UPI00315D1643